MHWLWTTIEHRVKAVTVLDLDIEESPVCSTAVTSAGQ